MADGLFFYIFLMILIIIVGSAFKESRIIFMVTLIGFSVIFIQNSNKKKDLTKQSHSIKDNENENTKKTIEVLVEKENYEDESGINSTQSYQTSSINIQYPTNDDLMNKFYTLMGMKKQKIVVIEEDRIPKKEPLQKNINQTTINISQYHKESLYMREFIYQYIENQNNSNYKENWQYIQLSKAFTEKSYIDFWESHQEQFILYEIDQENQTFTIVIDYENGYSDELLELHLKKGENQWSIINTKVLKRLKEFDKWKIRGDEKLQSVFSYTEIYEGSLYFLKPHTNSYLIKNLNENIEVKVSITTEEGIFYMSKWSFDKLLDGEISKNRYPNWILVKK